MTWRNIRKPTVGWLLAAICGVAIAPLAGLAFALWMASDAWRFEGHGVRYWLLLKGSRLERLGFVSPTNAPAKFTVAFDEGTFPGWNIVEYESEAAPIDVVTAYESRCVEQKLKINEVGLSPGSEASLTCEYEPYIDAEIFAERKQADAKTRVVLKVWGRE